MRQMTAFGKSALFGILAAGFFGTGAVFGIALRLMNFHGSRAGRPLRS